jgi:5-formyltetrahydrofolate cyclo-ligase
MAADPSNKRALRSRARALLLDAAAGAAAQQRLAALPELSQSQTVALFMPQPSEPPLQQVTEELERRQVSVVFPRVVGDALAFHRVRPDALRPGYGGISEPAASDPLVAVGAIDLFVVPGLLFDRSGVRLGRGGGHYDRTLQHIRAGALCVGYCTAPQLVDELPCDSWDVPMDVIVTDREVLRLRGSA